jgi:hypothetical protein
VVFKRGFSYSEGDKAKGELLPRWTTGTATFDLWANTARGPVSVTIRLADHRPPQLPRAQVTILVNDSAVEVSGALVPEMPISTLYSFEVRGRPARVTIASDTWNPSRVGENNRNEDIGVKLESVVVSEGGVVEPYSFVEDLAAPPYYPQPRWYYDPHFAADVWAVYVLEMNMGRRTIFALALPVVLVGLACAVAGWLGLARGGRWSDVRGQETVRNRIGPVGV